MEVLGESVAWREAIGLVAIKIFLEAHRDVFDLEEQGENVTMRLRSSTHNTNQNQRSAAGSPSSITNNGVWRRSGQVHWDTSVFCLSTLKVLPRFGLAFWASPAELRWTHNKIQRLFLASDDEDDQLFAAQVVPLIEEIQTLITSCCVFS